MSVSPQKRNILYCKNLVFFEGGIQVLDLKKSWKTDIRKKNYFPCRFDGLVQLLFGIGPPEINYLSNGVRKELTPN